MDSTVAVHTSLLSKWPNRLSTRFNQLELVITKCLNLALLVHRQHQGMLGRVEIETDDRLQLVCKLRIVTDFETLS